MEDSDNTFITCNRQHCNKHSEFEREHAGASINCPHCSMDTVLSVPAVPIGATTPELASCDNPHEDLRLIIATTGNEVSGRSIEKYLGIPRGVVVRSPNLVQGLFGGLNQIVGGNIERYAEVCEQARRDAFQRMLESAKELGADAVVAFRYDATEFAPGVTEVLACGTAVKLAR